MPVLTTTAGFDDWFFSVTDDFPVNWELQTSLDSGVTWLPQDDAPYTVDIADNFASGAWARAQRADAGLVPYGPTSNVIVIP